MFAPGCYNFLAVSLNKPQKDIELSFRNMGIVIGKQSFS